MGDLRTTINHRSVSCLKLLNAREPLAGSPAQPAPLYRESLEHGDRARLSKYLQTANVFGSILGFPSRVCRGACLDTSGGERPARAEERAGWMENTTAVAAFEANQV